ncbi:hypothetical protein CBM2589_A91001 [Cupriavidus taiwanensis]|uniref:Uncharacterized protein n=1 Tax=Cupriavidus taiwanensis TaxID=164546 RepID=A0A976A9J4_9BURK|nr:hypothetical protein CBM2589_A91001 [Cupriavidus taiwanensis]
MERPAPAARCPPRLDLGRHQQYRRARRAARGAARGRIAGVAGTPGRAAGRYADAGRRPRRVRRRHRQRCPTGRRGRRGRRRRRAAGAPGGLGAVPRDQRGGDGLGSRAHRLGAPHAAGAAGAAPPRAAAGPAGGKRGAGMAGRDRGTRRRWHSACRRRGRRGQRVLTPQPEPIVCAPLPLAGEGPGVRAGGGIPTRLASLTRPPSPQPSPASARGSSPHHPAYLAGDVLHQETTP